MTTAEIARVGYRRDRAFYASCPSGSYTPKIHRASVTRTGMAACDTGFTLLDMDSPIALVDDAERKAALCLRCFPLGQSHTTSPAASTGGDQS